MNWIELNWIELNKKKSLDMFKSRKKIENINDFLK